MPEARKVNFEFKNQVAPRYIESLYLQIEPGYWYSTAELQSLLRTGGLEVKGENIVRANVQFWSKIGLGEVTSDGRQNLFRLTQLGKQIGALYSTNQALFFDVMHFFFYSTWYRTRDSRHASFWLYSQVCDHLWDAAPSRMDSIGLTGWMQAESQLAFPDYSPSFPERSVRSVFPWLGALTPRFLSPCGTKSELCSERRSYCTSQLFHLGVDLIYVMEGLNYDTSLAMDERHIEAICRTCLLDTRRFWDMASLADMAIRELEIRKGQWGTSIALTGPPRWIELPDLDQQVMKEDEAEEEAA